MASEIIGNAESVLPGPELPPFPTNAKRLFLVRHGEVINPGGDRPVFYGAMDVPLSSLGEVEAYVAARYLAQFPLDKVASSPLSRAIYGANQVLQFQQQESKLHIFDGFKELDRGDWCGKTLDEIGREVMKRFDACDESVTPKNGESYPFLKERVLKARDELLMITQPGRASALVSHLQVTRSLLSDAMGIQTNEMSSLKVATASVTCIDYHVGNENEIVTASEVHFQSFKPNVGLSTSRDAAN